MAKRESTFKNMLLTLFVVTLTASTALGLVYNLTKDPIESAKVAKKRAAIEQVVPEFDNEPASESYKVPADGDSLVFYPAKQDGELVGMAIETFTNQGFSGTIRLMVGFRPDGTIHDITVLEHKETPGLGDKIEKSKSEWSSQFEGKNPASFQLVVKKDGGDVDAITASTITSRAYCEAVDRAYHAFMEGGKK